MDYHYIAHKQQGITWKELIMRDNMPPPKADYVDVVPQYDLYEFDEGKHVYSRVELYGKTFLREVVSTAIGCTCAIMFCSYVLRMF